MALTRRNLFRALPPAGGEEHFETLAGSAGVRVERIVSHGHRTPAGQWYDQHEDEWVCLLQGRAELHFDDGTSLALEAGDWLLIPAHRRHRVAATSSPAVWLAVFMSAAGRPGERVGDD